MTISSIKKPRSCRCDVNDEIRMTRLRQGFGGQANVEGISSKASPQTRRDVPHNYLQISVAVVTFGVRRSATGRIRRGELNAAFFGKLASTDAAEESVDFSDSELSLVSVCVWTWASRLAWLSGRESLLL
jgi:hypothetical protein